MTFRVPRPLDTDEDIVKVVLRLRLSPEKIVHRARDMRPQKRHCTPDEGDSQQKLQNGEAH